MNLEPFFHTTSVLYKILQRLQRNFKKLTDKDIFFEKNSKQKKFTSKG